MNNRRANTKFIALAAGLLRKQLLPIGCTRVAGCVASRQGSKNYENMRWLQLFR